MTSSNQVSGFSYDDAGNQLAIPGGGSYAYDAENHLVSTAGVNYTGVYPERSRRNGDGERVEKSNGEMYWYTSGGEVLDETDLSGNLTSEYIFGVYPERMRRSGARIARRDASGNVFYYLADHLGSSREIVQAGQTTPCYDADFYPFGGERAYTNTCQQNYKFTGKERDPESGLDNFEARYYGSTIGRFTSPDDPFVGWNLADPQSLNLYAYVQDNPINDVDPTGHMTSVCFTAGGSPATTAFASSDPCGFAANPMDPASDQEDPQTTYMTIADMGDPEGFGRANSIQTQAAAKAGDTQTPKGQNSNPTAPPASPTPQDKGAAPPTPREGASEPTCICANPQNAANTPPQNAHGQQAVPDIGTPEYAAAVLGQAHAEAVSGEKQILAPAAVLEGVGLAFAVGGPAVAAAAETAAAHPEAVVDFTRGFAAGSTNAPPMSPAGMLGWAVGNAVRHIIP